jgi:stage III sporulation protein AH
LKKIKKNQLIITALAIMIAAAGYINYTGNLSDIITVNDTVSTQDPTSNPVDEVSGDILSNDAEPDEMRNRLREFLIASSQQVAQKWRFI